MLHGVRKQPHVVLLNPSKVVCCSYLQVLLFRKRSSLRLNFGPTTRRCTSRLDPAYKVQEDQLFTGLAVGSMGRLWRTHIEPLVLDLMMNSLSRAFDLGIKMMRKPLSCSSKAKGVESISPSIPIQSHSFHLLVVEKGATNPDLGSYPCCKM